MDDNLERAHRLKLRESVVLTLNTDLDHTADCAIPLTHCFRSLQFAPPDSKVSLGSKYIPS